MIENSVLLALTWFIAGFMVAVPITTVFIASFGDTELNRQIRHLRRQRLEIAKIRFEIQLRRLIRLGHDRGYNMTISAKKPEGGDG